VKQVFSLREIRVISGPCLVAALPRQVASQGLVENSEAPHKAPV